LEAAAKARAKLSSIGGGAGSRGGAYSVDAKQISELHDQLTSLKDLSMTLPDIVERCHSLSQLHTCAANGVTRLAAVEQATHTTSSLLQSLDLTLTELERSTTENLETMQRNVQKLEEAQA
jgi:hypothetical protein